MKSKKETITEKFKIKSVHQSNTIKESDDIKVLFNIQVEMKPNVWTAESFQEMCNMTQEELEQEKRKFANELG